MGDWETYFSETVRSEYDNPDGSPRYTDRWIAAGFGSLADAVATQERHALKFTRL